MLSHDSVISIRKAIDALKQRKTALFTKEIKNSRAYARLFPRVTSLMNENEKVLVEHLNHFETLCMEIFSYRCRYDGKCANDFILELEALLLRIEELIKAIDWTN